jgi:hypothetical protein
MQHKNSIGIDDVLLGRGGATNNHEGNKRYRSIVAHHQHDYLAAKKKEKAIIARRVVSEVKENGGRFLKRDSSSLWVEVPDQRATEKTSQALREGLDVRNHAVRPKKQIRRSGGSDSKDKHQVIVTGWVMPDFPAVVSVSGEAAPDLHEEMNQPAFLLSRRLLPLQIPQSMSKPSPGKRCEV